MTAAIPNELELDALREIANVGCGNAATALSRMVGGKRVQIDVPRVLPPRPDSLLPLVEGEGAVVAAALEIEGGITGQMLLVWPEQDARELIALMGADVDGGSDPRHSALAELANVVCSACLTGIASLTGLQLQPTPPELLSGTGLEIAEGVLPAERAERAAVVLEARFHAVHVPPLSGRFFVIPDRAGLSRLMRAIGL
ncbi:MAG TPA: chemotaxis protein CheC [Myxococcaceae bacterium]|nr:chemotaxis protein CheC [Myxococcaceae bacterium]